MEKVKKFDCVEMKRIAQEQVRNDFNGLSDEEERILMIRELETSNDLAAQKWRAIRKQQKENIECVMKSAKRLS